MVPRRSRREAEPTILVGWSASGAACLVDQRAPTTLRRTVPAPRRIDLQRGRPWRARPRRPRPRSSTPWPPDDPGGRVLRRRQHLDAGRQHLPPGPRPHRRRFFTTREIASAAWKQANFRFIGAEDPQHVADAQASALAFIEGHTVAELEQLGEEIFDEAWPARIWPGTRALAQLHLDQGQRVWLVTAAPIEIAGIIARRLWAHRRARYRRRACRRRLHRPPGRHHAARPRQGGSGRGTRGARGARPRPLLGVLRLRQRPPDALAGRPRVRDQPRRQAARPCAAEGWRVYDYRTGRKAARAGCHRRAPAGRRSGRGLPVLAVAAAVRPAADAGRGAAAWRAVGCT